MYFGRPETGLININLPFLLEIRLHIPQSQDVYMGGQKPSLQVDYFSCHNSDSQLRWEQMNTFCSDVFWGNHIIYIYLFIYFLAVCCMAEKLKMCSPS